MTRESRVEDEDRGLGAWQRRQPVGVARHTEGIRAPSHPARCTTRAGSECRLLPSSEPRPRESSYPPTTMAVPDFQTLMLPVLQVFADGAEHASEEVRRRVAASLRLPESDLEELLPSGTQPAFQNRIHWALWYLRRCGLLVSTRRGVQRITDRGRGVLAKKPARVDLQASLAVSGVRGDARRTWSGRRGTPIRR